MPTSEVVQVMRGFKADIATAGSQQAQMRPKKKPAPKPEFDVE